VVFILKKKRRDFAGRSARNALHAN